MTARDALSAALGLALAAAAAEPVGRLLRTLRDTGRLDDTLVISPADQGIALGGQGLLGKQNRYDPSMKVPMVFAGPGIPHGRSDALVDLLDVNPTICDLVGADVPAGIDGRSVRPVLDGRATAISAPRSWPRPTGGSCLRTIGSTTTSRSSPSARTAT